MGKICWDFPSLGSGNEQGYSDAGTEIFKGTELIDNLAREVCQNSLDAKKGSEPVIVSFDLREYKIQDFDALSSLNNCLQGCKDFWGGRTKKVKENDFIKVMEKTFSEETIKTLIISDYQTKGLTGLHAGHDDDSAWRSLANSDGSSDKDDDTSGGNFGIGKNAPFACSSLKTVFYNTRAIDGGVAFQGTARWISMFNESGKATLGIGHYLNYEDETTWSPIFPEHKDSFANCFKRSEDEIGTDVIILGFNGEGEEWQKSITRAVLKNFFVAIWENKLIVNVGSDCVISKNTIKKLMDEMKDDAAFLKTKTRQLFYSYIEPTEVYNFSILEPNDVTFRIKIDESFSKVYANFRNNGMLIDQYVKRAIPFFSAVLVVNDIGEKKLSKLLRATEPPRHNIWDYKRIPNDTTENKKKRKDAKRALQQIQTEIIRVLDIYSTIEVKDQLDGGVGEFLSYDDKNQRGEKGTDKLRVVQKIKSIKDKNGRRSYEQEKGTNAVGTQKKGQGHRGGEPKPHPPKPPRPPKIIEINPDSGDTPGATKGKGKLLITATDIIGDRTYPVSVSSGIYKSVIVTARDYDNVYIKVSAVRDDRKEEPLSPVSYTISGKKHFTKDGIIGPIALKTRESNEIFTEFSEKEKMALELLILEELKNEKK